MKKKSIREKILYYSSRPREGEWTSAKKLSSKLKAPLEYIEFYICTLTDEGLLFGVVDKDTGEYWIKNQWQVVK